MARLFARLLLMGLLVSGCEEPTDGVTPVGWKSVALVDSIAFSLPPDATIAPGTAVDAVTGMHGGNGYRVTHDLGEFGESLDDYEDSPGYTASTRRLGGRSAEEVAFVPEDEPYAWARVAKVRLGDGRTLVLRVSCDSVERCALADRVFDSVRLDAGTDS